MKKITGIKKAMTKTMTASLSIPTFTFSDDADCTKLMALRQALKTQIEGGITKLPFMIKALSLAMEKFPEVNSTVSPELDSEGLITSYTIRKAHNYSIAVDTEHGLTTPVLKDVD